jgi:signal transduction histidine kinase
VTDRRTTWTGWALFGASTLFLLAAGALDLANDAASTSSDLDAELNLGGIGFALLVVALPAAGALILSRMPRHPIGWLFCGSGAVMSLSLLGMEYAQRAVLVDPGSLPLGDAVAWTAEVLSVPPIMVLVTFGFLLFPDGRLPSPRWRPVAWVSAVALALATLSIALRPGEYDGASGIDNPLGVEGSEFLGLGFSVLALCALASAASLVLRYRAAGDTERQQIRWVAAAASLLAVALLGSAAASFVVGDEQALGLLFSVGFLALVAAIAVAILRYRLYDLDLVVNRALVYGALTALVVAGYVGIVIGLGELLDSSGLGVSLIATAVVAVAIQPLRSIVQRRVNRLLFGDRDDPYRALSRLGERLGQTLDPDAVLPAIVEAVADGLRLPYVAIELEGEGRGRVAASHGEARGGDPVRLPLEYRGERVGWLLVSPRQGSERLAPADLRLLDDLARQAGVAAHAVALTRDLRRSRERLVAAREEERRRLRRDLHDGLGPTLAGVSLEIESARALAASDPAAADGLLAELKGQVQGAIADIRRIAHELRPPALDQLGLVGAVKQHADRLGGGNGRGPDGLRVSVETSAELPALPAAVEVAAYRIALEALTNASRHADARRCTVTISFNGGLELEVLDDGRGIPVDAAPGIGLSSMRERAEELGGRLTVETPAGGGTLVSAMLPVEGAERAGGSP